MDRQKVTITVKKYPGGFFFAICIVQGLRIYTRLVKSFNYCFNQLSQRLLEKTGINIFDTDFTIKYKHAEKGEKIPTWIRLNGWKYNYDGDGSFQTKGLHLLEKQPNTTTGEEV